MEFIQPHSELSSKLDILKWSGTLCLHISYRSIPRFCTKKSKLHWVGQEINPIWKLGRWSYNISNQWGRIKFSSNTSIPLLNSVFLCWAKLISGYNFEFHIIIHLTILPHLYPDPFWLDSSNLRRFYKVRLNNFIHSKLILSFIV